MATLPLLCIPIVRLDVPQFNFDGVDDVETTLLNTDGATVTTIQRKENSGKELYCIEVTFRATADAFKLAYAFLQKLHEQLSTHDMDITKLQAEGVVPAVIRVKDKQDIHIMDVNQLCLFFHRKQGDECSFVARLRPSSRALSEFMEEWMWRCGQLVKVNKPLTNKNVRAFGPSDKDVGYFD